MIPHSIPAFHHRNKLQVLPPALWLSRVALTLSTSSLALFMAPSDIFTAFLTTNLVTASIYLVLLNLLYLAHQAHL
jgi:hypothetical protein